jgi:hypothetical protein
MNWVVLAIVVLVAVRMYFRIRKQFGVQPLRPRKHVRRAIFLGIAGYAIAHIFVRSGEAAMWMGGGALGGVVLGVIGVTLAQIEPARDGQEARYTPNPWIGAVLSALLIGRVAWRLGKLAFGGSAAAAAMAMPTGDPAAQMRMVDVLQRSPGTLLLLGLLLGYNLCFQVGLAVQHARLSRAPTPS